MTEHRITTTMQPDRVVTVSDEELHDLERMNVVASRLDDPAPTTQEEVASGGRTEEEPEAERGQEAPAEAQRLRAAG